jgi:hypothetical protein
MQGIAHRRSLAIMAFVLAVIDSLIRGVPARASNVIAPSIAAIPVKGAPAPDGMPYDSDWTLAPALELRQQDPHPGEPTHYATEVRVLTDRMHLYLRVRCVDPDFGRRSEHTLERDSDQTSDDHVTAVDDPTARLAPISNAVIAKLRWDFRL